MPTALVTGASGFIAGHIIKGLIEKGYTVRGTVRNLQNPEKVSHLLKLFPTLQLFEADLLNEGSFDKAVEGVEYVFHTASPFFLTANDPQKDLVDPALKGTKNVLNAVIKSKSVKRVVVTSSIAALASKKPDGYIFTENDWNLVSTVDFEPYRYSKRIAEETAWEMAKGQHFDLITILPSFVLGPPLSSRTDATSISSVKALLDGSLKEKGTPVTNFGSVDVRDVAAAHIAAIEVPTASGRYMVTSSEGIPRIKLANILARSEKFSRYPLPTKEDGVSATPLIYDNSKVQKELGIKITPIEKTIIDMAEAFLDLAIIEPLN